jgi:hypothetical protein
MCELAQAATANGSPMISANVETVLKRDTSDRILDMKPSTDFVTLPGQRLGTERKFRGHAAFGRSRAFSPLALPCPPRP